MAQIDDRIKKTNLAGWNGIACTTEGDPFQGYNFLLFCGGSGRDNPRSKSMVQFMSCNLCDLQPPPPYSLVACPTIIQYSLDVHGPHDPRHRQDLFKTVLPLTSQVPAMPQ
eukprot:scpid97404/ scgid2602/ 